MQKSRRIAIALFVLFVVSSIAWSIGIEVLEVREKLGFENIWFLATVKARLFVTTVLMILYFFPLALYTKKHADIAEVAWLQKVTKSFLRIAVICVIGGILYLIFG